MVYNQQNDKPFWIEQALSKASKVKGLKFKHKKGKARDHETEMIYNNSNIYYSSIELKHPCSIVIKTFNSN
jgi:hypothetical protein